MLLLRGMFPVNFILYSKDLLVILLLLFIILPLSSISLAESIYHNNLHLYNNSTNFCMSQNNYHYILTDYTLASHKFNLSIDVLNLIFLLPEYLPLDKSFTSIHFLVRI